MGALEAVDAEVVVPEVAETASEAEAKAEVASGAEVTVVVAQAAEETEGEPLEAEKEVEMVEEEMAEEECKSLMSKCTRRRTHS